MPTKSPLGKAEWGAIVSVILALLTLIFNFNGRLSAVETKVESQKSVPDALQSIDSRLSHIEGWIRGSTKQPPDQERLDRMDKEK